MSNLDQSSFSYVRTENVLTWQTPFFLQGRYTFVIEKFHKTHFQLPPTPKNNATSLLNFKKRQNGAFSSPGYPQPWAEEDAGHSMVPLGGLHSLLLQMVKTKLIGKRLTTEIDISLSLPPFFSPSIPPFLTFILFPRNHCTLGHFYVRLYFTSCLYEV